MRREFTILAGALVLAAPTLAAPPATVVGHWITADGAALVAVEPCGAQLCGRIARVLKAAPNAPATDVNNSDPARRTRPILGLPILTNFVAGDGDWRGRIYDPRNGKTYKSIIKRNSNGTLKVQGCIAFFCQTQTWRPAR